MKYVTPLELGPTARCVRPRVMADQLFAFGWNGSGQLGTQNNDDQKTACPVESLAGKKVAMVACGGPYTILSTDDDEVWCARRALVWLRPRVVCCGRRRAPTQQLTNVDLITTARPAPPRPAPPRCCCLLLTAARATHRGFGANTRGQLGLDRHEEGVDQNEQLVPARLKPPIDSTGIRRSGWHVELIACGYAHTVFLTENLSVFSCGANSWGQLGLGDTDDRNTPCEVEMLSGVAVRQLDCGGAHTVVVCDGPRVPAKYQWWDMSSPKVTRSKGADKAPGSPPAEAPEFGESAGPPPPTASGVYGFGRNKEGQLGLGKGKGTQLAEQIQKQPMLVGELSPYLPMQGGLELKCGGYHTAVLVEKRTKLLTFGQNCYGQLGLGSSKKGQKDAYYHGKVDVWYYHHS